METNSDTCIGTAKLFPVTVSPYSIAEPVSGPEVVCLGDAGVTYSVSENAGSTYSWTVPPGVNITIPDSLHEINVTFTLSVTGNFSVIETNSSGCITVHDPLEVTVNDVNGGTISADQTVCTGDDPAAFTSVADGAGDGAITYQWQDSPDNVTFTDIGGATLATYDPGVPAATTYYKRITTSRFTASPLHIVLTCPAKITGTGLNAIVMTLLSAVHSFPFSVPVVILL